jgi:hypothetical protein
MQWQAQPKGAAWPNLRNIWSVLANAPVLVLDRPSLVQEHPSLPSKQQIWAVACSECAAEVPPALQRINQSGEQGGQFGVDDSHTICVYLILGQDTCLMNTQRNLYNLSKHMFVTQ